MFTKLTDTSKAAIFAVLVLCMSVGAALLIRFLSISSDLIIFSIWSCTPAVAALIMLLVVTRDGYTKEGWKSLGLHRLGLNVWWIAFGVTLLITVAASAVVWATPLASFVVPEDGLIDPILNFFIEFGMFVVWFSLAEEIGMRGYLQPHLMSLGRNRALLLVGLVFATWHMPLIFLTPLYHAAGNKLLVLPLFYGTVVAASFIFGYLRIYTGSVWPASIAHSVHNAAWGLLAAFTLTSSPVVVNQYLVGDNGILIFVGAVIVAIWVGRMLRRGMNQAQETGAVVPEVPPGPAAATVPR
jgi:membrane protease YdiL (CAAX protease family)